jgi:lysophospholipase L1-like esterase
MKDDGRHEGEYPGQMGMPFGEDLPRERGGASRGDVPSPRPDPDARGRGPDPDDDLFVWDLRPPRREEPRRPAESVPGDWRVSEFGAGQAGPGGPGARSDDRRTRAEREAVDHRYERQARVSGDWRAPEYPTGDRRRRQEPADGFETSEEWEEWLDPEVPRGAGTIGPPPERGKGPRRRRLSAGAVLLAMLLGFFVAGLLDVRTIKKDVEARPYGALRSLQLALLAPMTGLSGLVRADDLGNAVAGAFGRGDEEHHTLADARQRTKKSLWPRTITEEKPLRLYVAGDSMNQVFGSSLVNVSKATGLVKAKNDYKVSSGLSRPDFFDWPQRFVDQIVDYRPDAAVMLFGANDAQNVLYEGEVLKVGTKAWQEVYAERVGEAMDILTEGGRRVYWVGQPIMKDFGYRERIAMMNHIYEAEAKKRAGVTFVSTWKALANEKGSYAEYLPDENGDQVLMRAPDGIHLSRDGGDRMARVVLDVIMKDWGMGGAVSPSPAP